MSFDASTVIKSKRFGKYEVLLEAGSYNPGNQPEYGQDWEYYEVFVYVDSDIGMDRVSKKSFHNRKDAEQYYEKKIKEYANKDTKKGEPEWKKDFWGVKE